jgi:hypothetical protein
MTGKGKENSVGMEDKKNENETEIQSRKTMMSSSLSPTRPATPISPKQYGSLGLDGAGFPVYPNFLNEPIPSVHSLNVRARITQNDTFLTVMSFFYQAFFPSIILSWFRGCCYFILYVFDNNRLVLSHAYNYLMDNICILGLGG